MVKIIIRKILLLGLVVGLAAGCSSRPSGPQPTASGPRPNPTHDPTALLVGTDATFPPFESLDAPKRQIIGFDIDLIKAIADREEIAIEVVATRYGELLEGMASCEYSMGISAIPITDELKARMLFSEPYFVNGQVVVVKKGNIAISGRDSLAGMTVGTQKNTNSALELAQMPDVQVVPYPGADFAFQDLAEGLIDAVVADKLLALSYVSVKPNNLKIAGEAFAAESYGIAVCNQRGDLVDKINAGLAEVKEDGTVEKLQKKWLTSP